MHVFFFCYQFEFRKRCVFEQDTSTLAVFLPEQCPLFIIQSAKLIRAETGCYREHFCFLPESKYEHSCNNGRKFTNLYGSSTATFAAYVGCKGDTVCLVGSTPSVGVL